MKYLLLICESEAAWETIPPEQQGPIFQEYVELSENLAKAGKLLGGEPLEPVRSASTVRVRDGKTLVTDGPFAETREQIGGFYLVEAENLDEAIAIAARIPGARSGCVEVRPVMPMPG